MRQATDDVRLPVDPDAGVKFDGGKLRYDLIPHDALEQFVRVLTYGAEKYSRRHVVEMEAIPEWLANHLGQELPNASIRIDLCTPEGCVASATRNGCGTTIQSSQSDRGKTGEIGEEGIQTGAKSFNADASQTNLAGAGTDEQRRELPCCKSDCPRPDSHCSCLPSMEGVPSANETLRMSPYTLITTIKQGSLEDCFAADATTVSGCLEMALRDYAQRSLISKTHRLEISPTVVGVEVTVPGARNWEKGMDWSRLYAAALRHLTAWWRGNDIDHESGLPHLAHALCCINFLLAYELRGMGRDDRPWPA